MRLSLRNCVLLNKTKAAYARLLKVLDCYIVIRGLMEMSALQRISIAYMDVSATRWRRRGNSAMIEQYTPTDGSLDPTRHHMNQFYLINVIRQALLLQIIQD